MTQSRTMSLAESVTNVVAGFVIALLIQTLLFRAIGIIALLAENIPITLVFTAVPREATLQCLTRPGGLGGHPPMKGRRPKPTALRVIQGNAGKRALNDREPKPSLHLPSCPSHLLPAAKAEWKRLVRELYDLGVITRLDRAALAGYCQAYGRWVEAEKKLQETPLILKMPSGYVQQNPWLTISTKQMELMHKFAAELGMTPSSRSRVEIIARSSSLAGHYFNSKGPSNRFSTMPKPWEMTDEFFDD